MHKKGLKFAPVVDLANLKFTYNHSTKIAKAGPGFDDQPEPPSVQINSSSPWLETIFWTICLLSVSHLDFYQIKVDPSGRSLVNTK